MDFDNDLAEGKMHSKRLGREMAMQFLFQCDMNRVCPDLAGWRNFFTAIGPEHGLHENRYARKAGEYSEHLVTGVVVHLDEIDAMIKKASANWEFDRLSIVDRNLMRIAVFEMLFEQTVPPVVSINEAVEIALDYSDEKAGSFINGVLNGIKDTLDRPAREVVKVE